MKQMLLSSIKIYNNHHMDQKTRIIWTAFDKQCGLPYSKDIDHARPDTDQTLPMKISKMLYLISMKLKQLKLKILN